VRGTSIASLLDASRELGMHSHVGRRPPSASLTVRKPSTSLPSNLAHRQTILEPNLPLRFSGVLARDV
jgi:hypothetical protein